MGHQAILIADSVTKLADGASGAVAIVASHGGVFAAHMALAAGLVGVVLNDAGIGLDDAGVGGLVYLDPFGVAAAAIDHGSARIGDGADCAARGMISRVNNVAGALGVRVGMSAGEAAERMRAAVRTGKPVPAPPREARSSIEIPGAPRPVRLLDSASLIGDGDCGSIVITGSHGGLLGGNPATAAKADVFAAAYNDAGIGADEAGVSRLPALDARGIAGVTVDARTARIGDARSAYDTGRLSRVNAAAAQLGAKPGMSVRAFAELLSHVPLQEA